MACLAIIAAGHAWMEAYLGIGTGMLEVAIDSDDDGPLNALYWVERHDARPFYGDRSFCARCLNPRDHWIHAA